MADEERDRDLLDQTVAIMRNNPYVTDEQLSQQLDLKRPASARFWRLKAKEILAGQAPPQLFDPNDPRYDFHAAVERGVKSYTSGSTTKEGKVPMQQQSTNNVPPANYFDDDDDTLSSPVTAPPKKRGLLSSLLSGLTVNNTGVPAQSTQLVPQHSSQEKGLTTSTMSQEQLRTRRMNLIEGSKFGRPFHENVMLFVLKFWLVLGPIAFVALTTSEVAYILTHLVAPGDRNGQTVIWGGALFIDLAMMFTTFGVAIKRRDLAEKREANGSVSKREEGEVWFGTLLWLIFAIINIVSQAAFLLHVIQSAGSPPADMSLLYLFVGSRVVGFILGDASTAFFLAKVDNSQLKLLARAEREKGALYKDIAQAEGARRLTEAKAEAEVRLVQIEVEEKEQDAMFLADLKRQVFTDILNRRPSAPEPNGPNRSRLSRSDS